MSAIGDYIHYSAQGYDEHGTTLNGAYKAANYNYQMQKIKNNLSHISPGLSQEKLDEFGEMISSFMTEPEKMPRGEEALKAFSDELFKKFQIDLDSGMFNMGSMKLTGVNVDNAIGKVKAHKGENGKLYMDLREITNKINRLEEVYLKEFNKKSVNTKDFIKLRQRYKDLVGKSVKSLRKYDFVSNKDNLKLEGSYKEIGELRNLLNDMINRYASYPCISNIEGISFENAIALASYAADSNANISTDEAILNVLGGNIKRMDQYNKAFFSREYTEQLGENTFLDAKYNKRSKIDVELNWKGTDLRISAKNISFNKSHTWVTVVSESPLLSMIQDIEGDFVNHWINIHAIHGASQKSKVEKNNINSAMKGYIFYKAVTGDVYKSDSSELANLFVINDKNSKGKVIVRDMKDIFNKALQNLDRISVAAEGRNINELKLKNVWSEPDYNARLHSILTQMHELKVKAMFNANSILY